LSFGCINEVSNSFLLILSFPCFSSDVAIALASSDILNGWKVFEAIMCVPKSINFEFRFLKVAKEISVEIILSILLGINEIRKKD